MTDENKQPNEAPKIVMAKTEEEAKTLKLSINLEKVKNYKVPSITANKALSIWESGEKITDGYLELFSTSQLISKFLAISCNEGAEVNESVTKRMVLAKAIIEEFLENISLNGWMVYGLLSEIQHDVYQDMSGAQKTIDLLKKINKLSAKKSAEKSKSYVT